MNQSVKGNKAQILYGIARGLVIITASSAMLIATLIIINYYQVSNADPLNSPALVILKDQLRDDPSNILLQEQVRSLDLLARKSYFTNLWQLKTGGYIIIGCIILLLLSLKIAKAQERRLPDPIERKIIPDYLRYSRVTQLVIIGTGIILITGAVIVALFTPPSLNNQLSDEMVQEMDRVIDLNNFWPNFRGPGGLGIAVHTNVPTTWDGKTGEHILWKSAVPLPGFSSPIVLQNRLFVSGGDKNTREVYCFDNESGDLVWTKTVPNMLQPDDEFDFDYVDPGTGFAAPTMATNGQNVYAIFATGDVICYSMSGDQIWGRNLGTPDNHYAHSSSLIVHENLCLIQYESFSNPRLIALNCDNGSIVWETKRSTISWASPIIAVNNDHAELIVADSKSVAGYNPLTGIELWYSACLSGEVGPSPAFVKGYVFVANEYALGTALRIGEPATEPEILWQIEDNLPNASSPVTAGEFVVLATSSGLVTLLDASTGEIHWEEYLGNGFFSSPIIVGDAVYLTDLEGTTFIFNLDKQFNVRATNQLSEAVSTTPAFLDGRIYIRSDKHIYCISESDG